MVKTQKNHSSYSNSVYKTKKGLKTHKLKTKKVQFIKLINKGEVKEKRSIKTKKIQYGQGWFFNDKKKNILDKFKIYTQTISDYYFKELDNTITHKKFADDFKYSYQKYYLKKLNTKYKKKFNKCILKILMILYKKDKYSKSTDLVTDKYNTGLSLYKILFDNKDTIVTNFFTEAFQSNRQSIKNLDTVTEDAISNYINTNVYNNGLILFKSTSSSDRHFNYSNNQKIALVVKKNNITIIDNVFTHLKFYINYLKNKENQIEKKQVKKLEALINEHFAYLCNNKNNIATFFINYVKYRYGNNNSTYSRY